MPEEIKPDVRNVRFELRMMEEDVEAIDAYRVSKRPVVSRAQAVRELMWLGIEAAKRAKKA